MRRHCLQNKPDELCKMVGSSQVKSVVSELAKHDWSWGRNAWRSEGNQFGVNTTIYNEHSPEYYFSVTHIIYKTESLRLSLYFRNCVHDA